MVVTAAHCLNDTSHPARYRLIAGLKDQRSLEGEYSYKVSQIIPHPGYLQGTYNNDIALLLTDGDIVFDPNKKVLPICLPRDEADSSATVQEQLDKKGYATGWGMTENGKTGSSLKCGEVGELDADSCREQLFEHNHFLLYNDAVFCARAPESRRNRSTVCFSDHGGGLSVFKADRWYLWGIASVAAHNATDVTECDLNGIVGFTAVANYTKWIDDNQNAQKQTYKNLLRDPNCGTYQNETLATESGNAVSYQYPWNVLLELQHEISMYVCGGVLIHKRFVLTISHCLVGIPPQYTLIVRLGASTKDSATTGQSILAERIIPNPNFNEIHYGNNLALIQLKYDADITKPTIKPICLPSVTEFLPTNLTLTGWMRNQHLFPTLSRDSINTVSAAECGAHYDGKGMELPDVSDSLYGVFNTDREKVCDNYNAGSVLQYAKLSDQTTRVFLAGLLMFNYPESCSNGCETFVTTGYNASWIYDAVKDFPAND
uniref:Peptidase S1 domain-containing protein n=2 Tax=Anopheles darlingi TaxID=43151 RepID=A0A087ZGU9_ANODA